MNNQLYLHNLDKEKLLECLKSIGIAKHSSQAEKLLKKLAENQDQLNAWLGDLQWLLSEMEDRAKIESSFLELLDVQEEKLSVWIFDELLSPNQLMKFSTFLSQQWLAKSLYHPIFALILEFDDDQKVQLKRLSRRLDAVREKMFSESNRAKVSAQLEKHFFDTLCVLRAEQLVAYLRITGKASATDRLAEAIKQDARP
ncbi:MAG: hypothetical protein R3C53_00290 [Pirellulaceae bacterium]